MQGLLSACPRGGAHTCGQTTMSYVRAVGATSPGPGGNLKIYVQTIKTRIRNSIPNVDKSFGFGMDST